VIRPKYASFILLAAWLSAAPRHLGASGGDFSSEAVGTTGSDFLLYDVGARGIGMGGAYTAVTNDAYSLYWNPAGLTKIPRASATFMYSHNVAQTSYQSASYAQRINETSVIAAGWRYQNLGSLSHTDISNTVLGSFQPRNYAAEAGWGQAIYDMSDSDVDMSVGATARWIHSDMLVHANAYGGDVGIQSRFYVGSYFYDIGFTAQNMGMGQKFDKIRDTLPFRARLGGAIYPIKPLIVSLEAIMPINNVPAGALGAEYTLDLQKNMQAMLRLGFNSSTVKSLGPFSAMSMGLGFKFSELSLDYAFVPFGVLGTGDVHRLSISFNLPTKNSKKYRQR